jgi:hypothetical protein
MEETKPNEKPEVPGPVFQPVRGKIEVFTVRNWKEYLGESLLIMFSVLLALILTEFINDLHDKKNTREILHSIIAELRHNEAAIGEMKQYNTSVLAKIDSALTNNSLQAELVAGDEFHLNVIAPEGVLYRYLDDAAWTIAKNNNTIAKLDVETVALLTRVYEDQAKMMRVEDEVAKVIIDRTTRDPAKVHATLVIIRDLYHGWAVDRTDGLIKQIDNTIRRLQSF